LSSNFESEDVESISKIVRVFEDLVRLIFSELRYQSEGIDTEDSFLILESWIRDVMELASRYNIYRRFFGGELIV
jgi:hypothetical protein